MKNLLHTAFNQYSTPDDGKCAEVVHTTGETAYEYSNSGQITKTVECETFRFVVSIAALRELAKHFNEVADSFEGEDE